METIVKITKEKGQFYLIWLSSGEKLRVSEDTLVRQRLLKGQEVTDSMTEQIRKDGTYDVGLQLALNYLNYQLRSKKELLIYLKEKEIPEADRQKISRRLQEMNLIDDHSYSESYVRTLIRTGDKGPRQIEQQLKMKGIDETEITHGLSFYTLDKQVDLAKKVAVKAMHRYQQKSFTEGIQKVTLHLIQKGFERQAIDLALDELSFEKDEGLELEALKKEGNKLWEKHRRLELSKRKMKVKQSLYQKRFDLDAIEQYIIEKELENEEE